MATWRERNWLLHVGWLLAVAATFLMYRGTGNFSMSATLGILVLMAFWWMTEAVNIYITSLLPVVLFPLLDIMPMKAVAPLYMKDVIFLYIGGFVLTYAIERWNLHRRISLGILLRFGSSHYRLLFGFMLAAYLLSMWLNNTSTTLMMLPIALAVIHQLHHGDTHHKSNMAAAILIGISFASSIGGTATLVGTLPNMVLKDFYDSNFTGAYELTFSNWFMIGFPLSLVFFIISYFVIRRVLVKQVDVGPVDMAYCKKEYGYLGRMSYEEKVISAIFGLAIIMWFTLEPKDMGAFILPGWSSLLPDPAAVTESYVAIFMAFLLFFWPSKGRKGEAIVTWEEVKRIPLGIIFLFGGGFALAQGMDDSGLSDWVAAQLILLQQLPVWLIILLLCLITTLFSEFASNTATVILFLTILIPVVAVLPVPPMVILFPVTIAASYSFMLPVGTPPNTIVFGTEKVSVRQMMRTGAWLDLLGAVVITLFMLLVGIHYFS
jgi:sodium-dependent dicarboxylate transporter 2/3/5